MFSQSSLHSLECCSFSHCCLFFSLSHNFYKLLSVTYKSDIPGNNWSSSTTLRLGTFDFMERECCMCFLMTQNGMSFHSISLTSMQCLCFKSEICHFYRNFIKGFEISSWCNNIHTNLKSRCKFIQQSYHN